VSSRSRPGLGHLICTILAGVIAVLGVIAAIALTAVDANDPPFPNTIVTGVDAVAATAAIMAVALIASWHAQTRVLAGQDRVLAAMIDLKSDTGQIPKLAMSVVDAPEIIVMHGPWPSFQEAPDRDEVLRVLAEADARADAIREAPPSDDVVKRISREAFELGRKVEQNRTGTAEVN
jgi:hypothetical protein